ncbi:MAG: hypothetical protein COB50_03595 [Thiotrichales bacterium]|nr:MAG: hypothetical protein COB50_03595 [Thiotrichales bacterium]
MRQFGITLLKLCLLRSGPQDIPYSTGLLVTLATILVIFISRIMSVAFNLETAIALAVVSLLLTWIFVYAMVTYLRLRSRLVQIMITMLGVDLLALCSVGILKLAVFFPSEIFVITLLAFLSIWKLTVYAHIFEQGFRMQRLYSIILAITYSVVHGIGAHSLTKLIT